MKWRNVMAEIKISKIINVNEKCVIISISIIINNNINNNNNNEINEISSK
jgi:hypothetical protein